MGAITLRLAFVAFVEFVLLAASSSASSSASEALCGAGLAAGTCATAATFAQLVDALHLNATGPSTVCVTSNIDWPSQVASGLEQGISMKRAVSVFGVCQNQKCVLKGNQKRMDELTVAMTKDGEGFLATYEIAMTAL